MRKLISVLLLLFAINSVVGQNDSAGYKNAFNSVYKSLDRKQFNYYDFADSVKMFIFIKNNLAYGKDLDNYSIVNDLNTILLRYLPYDYFKVSEAHNDEHDKGFIVMMSSPEVVHLMFIVVNEDNKIKIILIR